MKTIIHPKNDQFTTASALTGKEFIAYATKIERPGQKSTYCVLSRLEGGTKEVPGKFGFINLGYTATSASFVCDTIEECVSRASKGRDVRVFDTMEEMLAAILNKSF